jgi:hypothetical protein
MSIQASRQLRALVVAVGVVVACLSVAGCYAGPAGVEVGADYEVGGPPPPLQDEVVVATPGPDFVWIGGHYEYGVDAKSYTWKAGSWERPPHPGATWVAPRYEERGGKRIYHAGHWDHHR